MHESDHAQLQGEQIEKWGFESTHPLSLLLPEEKSKRSAREPFSLEFSEFWPGLIRCGGQDFGDGCLKVAFWAPDHDFVIELSTQKGQGYGGLRTDVPPR